MAIFKKTLLLLTLFITGKVFSQTYQANSKEYKKAINGGDPNGIYSQAAKLCEAAAEKYDAKGCSESAAYLRKMRDWNLCMVSNLSGNACGVELHLENAPKCDVATIGGTGSGISSGSSSDPYKQMQLKQQQTQQELNNAQSVSINAYQEAINSGKKESGAMLDATLAGAQQISDPATSLVYTGIGLGISLFAHLSEKKAEKKEKELAAQKEEDEKLNEARRKRLIIETKDGFIKEALDINKYTFSDLIAKDRYATILLVPKPFNAEEQNILFTYPIQIMKYSDETYPLKPEIEKKLVASIDRNVLQDKSIYTLYPITDIEKFTNDFVKKMGSGKVIYLNAELLKFLNDPFAEDNQQDDQTDFWGNPLKKETSDPDVKKKDKKSEKSVLDKPAQKPVKNKDDFWNN